MHILLKKHTYILKAGKLGVIQYGWLVFKRTPSEKNIKMEAINFTNVLLFFNKLAISLCGKDKLQ